MNSDPNEFEALRKLMALKRHEQPPLGYFDRLPGQILARLENEEAQPGFWDRFLAHFTFRPAFVYGFCMVALCALSLSIIYAVSSRPDLTPRAQVHDAWPGASSEESLAGQPNQAQSLHIVRWMENDNPSNVPPSTDNNAQTSPLHVSFASP